MCYQSPLLSVYRVAFNFRFTLPGDMFPNVDRIRQVRCPVFVIHGTRDEIVPFRNGEVCINAVYIMALSSAKKIYYYLLAKIPTIY